MVRHVLTWQPNWQDPTINNGWVGGCSEAVTNWHIPAHRHMNKSSPAQINRISTGPIEEFSVRRTQFLKGTIFQYICSSLHFTRWRKRFFQKWFNKIPYVLLHTGQHFSAILLLTKNYFYIFIPELILEELWRRLCFVFYIPRCMETTANSYICICVLYYICMLKTICYKAQHSVYIIYVCIYTVCTVYMYIYTYIYILYTLTCL